MEQLRGGPTRTARWVAAGVLAAYLFSLPLSLSALVSVVYARFPEISSMDDLNRVGEVASGFAVAPWFAAPAVVALTFIFLFVTPRAYLIPAAGIVLTIVLAWLPVLTMQQPPPLIGE